MTQTSIHVHLDYTIVNGGLDFLLGRARATVEHKVAGTQVINVVPRREENLPPTAVAQHCRRSSFSHMPGVGQEARGAAGHFRVCKRHAHYRTQPLC